MNDTDKDKSDKEPRHGRDRNGISALEFTTAANKIYFLPGPWKVCAHVHTKRDAVTKDITEICYFFLYNSETREKIGCYKTFTKAWRAYQKRIDPAWVSEPLHTPGNIVTIETLGLKKGLRLPTRQLKALPSADVKISAQVQVPPLPKIEGEEIEGTFREKVWEWWATVWTAINSVPNCKNPIWVSKDRPSDYVFDYVNLLFKKGWRDIYAVRFIPQVRHGNLKEGYYVEEFVRGEKSRTES